MKRYRGTSEAQLLKATADLGDLFDTHKETLEAKADELKRTCSAHMDRPARSGSGLPERGSGRSFSADSFCWVSWGAGVVGVAALEQSFRWQVAKAASMAERGDSRWPIRTGSGADKRCCMDHPEGCLIIVFFNTGDNLDAT